MNKKEIEHLFTYHAPNPKSIIALQEVRNKAKELAEVIDLNVSDCPDKTVSIRKLREAVMTANAAIVLNQVGI